MATVRLEFDLDSDVYPELHAALLRLGDASLRGERIRQLATAGLVWENVRIHGAAAIGPNPAVAPVPPRGVPPAPVPAPLPVFAAEVEPPAERKPPRPKKTPARRRDDVRGADFVDLAISAEPVPPPFVERRAAPRDLPVLMDVVADEEVVDSRTMALAAAEPAPVPRPPPPLPPSPPPVPDPAPLPMAVAVETSAEEEPVILPVDPHHLASLAETPQRRSRLMRMKERGLFKNG